jgi:hypothetical protein
LWEKKGHFLARLEQLGANAVVSTKINKIILKIKLYKKFVCLIVRWFDVFERGIEVLLFCRVLDGFCKKNWGLVVE